MENKVNDYSKHFEKVLDDDEKILGVFKPHKGKFFTSVVLCYALLFLMFAVGGICACLLPEEGYEASVVGAVIVAIIYVALVMICVLFSMLYYKNIFYAYTNKRVIIRSGIFGVDYKNLDMAMIGAVNVYVSLIDKIVGKNTGTITFGSMASPMYSANGAGTAYKFSHIKMPYELCKQIKAQLDVYKKEVKEK